MNGRGGLREGFNGGIVETKVGVGLAGEDGIGICVEAERRAGIDELTEGEIVLIESSGHHEAMDLRNVARITTTT